MADQRVRERSTKETNDIIIDAVMEELRENPSSSPRWQEIANGLQKKSLLHRSGRQIRELWVNYLNPSLNFEKFTPEEMQILQTLYYEAHAQNARGQTRMLESGNLQLPLKENGDSMSWEHILPRRSPNVVKTKYYSHQKYWNQPERQPGQDQLYRVEHSISEERDDDVSNNYDFYDSDLHERSKRGDSPPPFAFPLTTRYDIPSSSAAFGSSFDERGGGKSARKSARKPSRKSFRKSSRKSSRKAKKSSRKYRKVTRK
jgi:hypothetical protein